tara:strand:- start:1461 stop:2054 length:594 start_codon:yes stop_codon:yes gene_type:complete
MEAAFFSDPLEAEIVKDIRLWSSEILEKPSPYFNNIPPCPYAKKAWMSDRVAILFIHENNHQTLYSCISQWDDKQDIALIADLGNTKNVDEFHEYLDQLNQVISDGMFIDRDIWLMGFHPDDDPSEFVQDAEFITSAETPYAVIFVQRLSKLQQAADKLNKKGYYDTYGTDHDAHDIYQLRETLYRKLKDGDETKES